MNAPPGWIRVLVRSRHPGDLRHRMDHLGGEWNPSIRAWVIEPARPLQLNRETQQWEPHRDDAGFLLLEMSLRALGGSVELEWQTEGPSLRPRRREDVVPAARTNRGFETPYFGRKVGDMWE